MYLDWKRSSRWLESWEGLLSVTDVSTTCAEAILTLMVASAQVVKMSVTKGLITWAGLARLAGLLRCAQMTFSPVLHRVSQPGWWLMRWTAFGAKKARAAWYIMAGSYIFKTDTTRMRQMIVIAFFQQPVVLLFCIHAVTWTFIFVSSI